MSEQKLAIEFVEGGIFVPRVPFNLTRELTLPTVKNDLKLLIFKYIPRLIKRRDIRWGILLFFIFGVGAAIKNGELIMSIPIGISAVVSALSMAIGIAISSVSFGAAFVRAELGRKAFPRVKAYLATLLGLPLMLLSSVIFGVFF